MGIKRGGARRGTGGFSQTTGISLWGEQEGQGQGTSGYRHAVGLCSLPVPSGGDSGANFQVEQFATSMKHPWVPLAQGQFNVEAKQELRHHVEVLGGGGSG